MPPPSPTAVPWHDWKLDSTFVQSLSAYESGHPETTFDKVIGAILTAADYGKSFESYIPNSPFPAQTVVTAIISILTVGKEIKSARGNAVALAKEIAEWIENIIKTFQNHGPGVFTTEVWDHLQKKRDLVIEIFDWAHTRMTERGLKRITHGLKVKDEIQEFKQKFAKARDDFMEVSVVTLTQAAEAQLDLVGEVKAMLEKREEKDMAKESRDQLRGMLSRRVDSPAYRPDRLCLEDTRVDIFDDLARWYLDLAPESPRLYWITGIPGCGKSSIVSSFTQALSDTGKVWAEYRFDRQVAATTSADVLFPSLASQFADPRHPPSIAEAILKSFQNQPSLANGLSPAQAEKLFTQPLQSIAALDSTSPVILVIDALDECAVARRKDLARLLSKAIGQLPVNVKIVISSRPEDDIVLAFRPLLSQGRAKMLNLDTESASSIHDVRVFVEHRFKEIRDEYNEWRDESEALDPEWPGSQRIDELCARASGLFVWAKTALAFVADELEIHGEQRIAHVFDILLTESMGDIDQLYLTVLQQAYNNPRFLASDFEVFRKFMGAVVLLVEPLPRGELKKFLDLRVTQGTREEIPDFVPLFARLRSILAPAVTTITDDTKPNLHKSFVDFITDASRCTDARFCIDAGITHEHLSLCSLRILNTLRRNPCSLEDVTKYNSEFPDLQDRIRVAIPPHMRYAYDGPLVDAVVQAFQVYLSRHLLNWLEVMSLLRVGGPGSTIVAEILYRASRWAKIHPILKSDDTAQALLFDAMRFAYHFHNDLSSAASQLYITMLPWCPTNSHIYAQYMPYNDPCARLVSGSPSSWSSVERCIFTISATAITYSPDGAYLLMGNNDWGELQLRHVVSGWTHTGCYSFGRHREPLKAVSFSRDGRKILTRSQGLVYIWESSSYTSVFQLASYSDPDIRDARLSSDGLRAYIALRGRIITLDSADGREVGSSQYPDGGISSAVSIHPDERHIILGTSDGAIEFYDTKDARLEWTSKPEGKGRIDRLLFSPDGSLFAATQGDYSSLHIFHTATGQLRTCVVREESFFRGLSWSPDNSRIALGMILARPVDAKVRSSCGLWDLSSEQEPVVDPACTAALRQWPPDNEVTSSAISTTTFSPDGEQILAVTDDGYIQFWDCSILRGGLELRHFETARDRAMETLARNTVYKDFAEPVSFSDDDEWVVGVLGKANAVNAIPFLPVKPPEILSQSVLVYEARTGSQILRCEILPPQPNSVVHFTPSKEHFVLVDFDIGLGRTWHIGTASEVFDRASDVQDLIDKHRSGQAPCQPRNRRQFSWDIAYSWVCSDDGRRRFLKADHRNRIDYDDFVWNRRGDMCAGINPATEHMLIVDCSKIPSAE
ncbi:hypothetical protein PLICRDRAFT_169825 [Plicaturopsis crispa FD-325 SS-3]|nr:hypothetical protein PLICRDRAFT_169825 [Plicaturopsis crispa FD-325 SS-3]